MTAVYRFGRFELSPATRRLLVDNQPVPLGARAFDVLQALVEHRERVVTKAELLDLGWPGLVIEENNLQVQVSALRKILGPAAIVTVAARGYRFALELTSDALAPPPEAPPTDNLPHQLTSLIGRERELAEVRELLAHRRLVTVIGAGGIGKTRLALQVAGELRHVYPEGVWLVEFGSFVDPSLVPSLVARVLGVDETPLTSPTQTLCTHLKSLKLLLVLDNCEHLISACARLAEALLAAAPGLRILATSQEPLHISGEQTIPLTALSLPDLDAGFDGLARSAAVRLFIDRARMQRPGFELNERQGRSIAAICTHLDGIPLALELAAARIHSLSIEEISAGLEDRFNLLTGGSRIAAPRQQTLRATLDWSHGMLTEPEQKFLRRLAIFAGGFTLEAAVSVAADKGIREPVVMDMLSELVTRSMIVAETNYRDARYRLLETIQIYAIEKLADAGETAAVERRRAEFFRQRFEHSFDAWLRLPDADWHADYLPEHDNVRAALDWAFGPTGNTDIGVALTSVSAPLWIEMTLVGEARRRLGAAVAAMKADVSQSDQAPLLLWLGVACRSHDPAQSTAMLQRAVELYRSLGDALGIGYALARLAGAFARMDHFHDAERALDEALPLLQRCQLPKALARCFDESGDLKMLTGDPTSARMYYEKALALYRAAGAERYVLIMLGALAQTTWELGDLDAAVDRYQEVRTLMFKAPIKNVFSLGWVLGALASLYTERAELEKAQVAMRDCRSFRDKAGEAWIISDHYALLVGLMGKITNAARVAGYMDSALAAKNGSRSRAQVRARDKLQSVLREKLDPDELVSLLAEGATMTQDQATRLITDD